MLPSALAHELQLHTAAAPVAATPCPHSRCISPSAMPRSGRPAGGREAALAGLDPARSIGRQDPRGSRIIGKAADVVVVTKTNNWGASVQVSPDLVGL